ncbi:putative uridine permease [Melanomma pulvis-pyrius CBS 109.77]|uniref:Putative uridine permease n=1 Tax=Melanomma pulvis-pyrius CBS 109.77 TaxID=1314802 RepID=A0A6A6XB61_9PLEO|nr:putative uridine permease [Melanomma pulvis-pyrius CBS 109.77]
MTSFASALKRRLVIKGSGENPFLDNDDIRPLSLEDRTWTQTTYFTFWFSAAATVAGWYSGSAAQSTGLSVWEVVACQAAGYFLIAIVFVANGRPGAVYHIGFPILNRAAFGVYGAWWPTFNRAVMAVVWNGVNMGKGSALTSGGMIGYVIFWLMICSVLWIRIPKMRILIYIKLLVYIISAIGMLTWTLTLAGGIGPILSQGSRVHGSEKAWLIVRFVWLFAANCATFASNAADFQRYAQKPNDVILGNLVGFPVADLSVAIVGNIVASTSTVIFGELVWNPIMLLDRIQAENYTAANRAGCFFLALLFAYSALFSSVFENSIPAGNDIAALVPKYISIRRGMFLCQVLSFLINPWFLLSSASVFIRFLGSYQMFLAAITGILLCNYYVVSRGELLVPDLFMGGRSGAYYFSRGWNFRAYIAYVVTVAVNFAGFLGNMGVEVPIGITRFYYFAYPVGLFLSFSIFLLCNLISRPAHIVPWGRWREPKNYVRPEEDTRSPGIVLIGTELDSETGSNKVISAGNNAEKGLEVKS